jgi:hypothetical protein
MPNAESRNVRCTAAGAVSTALSLFFVYIFSVTNFDYMDYESFI